MNAISILPHLVDAKPILDYGNDFENFLLSNGFDEDCDKDERTTYVKNDLYITIYRDGDMILESSETSMWHCISMDITKMKDNSPFVSTNLYIGRRPQNIDEVHFLFKELDIDSYLDSKD